MKIILTDLQALFIIDACKWAQNDDFPPSDPINKRYQRIIDKLNKKLNGK